MSEPESGAGAVEVFSAAVALPMAERAAYLDRACRGDGELQTQVERLLAAHEEAGDFLEQPPVEIPSRDIPRTLGEKPGDRIGCYKLLQQIGEGGWGVVFMAEQDQPVRRQVALKVVKPGMDTRNVIARFEAERQALALMEHANIAKVLDAGATDTGRPYFVMELVRGIKITEYCDQHALSTVVRLELFVQVCHAVQHAHQKGIIHRDLKPSNILVTTGVDGAPLPKVIDFGIAKATSGQRLTDKTVFTAFEMLIGTPAYMSPEQAAMTSVDVDTRTDIYSLGVLLYELLTGTTPFDTAQLLKAGLDEVRRAITQQEPVRPSTRLSTMLAPDLAAVAQRRRMEAPKLIRAVRGDLDWIVVKALEKDRTRRYATANGLALDIKRCLANEPISARPPSSLYRLQKAALRNKWLFGATAFGVSVLVVGLILVSASFRRERAARLKAETEEARSSQVTRFLEDMLRGVGPSAALGEDTRMLRGILDRTAERLGKELANQPSVEAELRGLIGRLYLEIGNYEGARQMHQAELALYRMLSGAESQDAAAALHGLGNAYWKQRKLTEAEAAYGAALAIRRRLLGNEHADVAATLNSLGAVYRRQHKLAESEALTREGLDIRRKWFGNEHLDVADSLRNLSIVLGDLGRTAEAETAAREMLAMRRRLLGNNHPLVAAALGDLAWVVGFTEEAGEVESLESEAFEIKRKILGETHPDVANSIYSFGDRMRQRGNLLESYKVLAAALSIQRKLLGEDHPDVLATLRSLGSTLEVEGNWAEAETMHRNALAAWRRRGEGETPQALMVLESLVRALAAQKKFGDGEQLLDEALTPLLVRQPPSAGLLLLRAELRARRSQWQRAADDAVLYFEHRPIDSGRFPFIAALLVKSKNHDAYGKFCRSIVEAYANTTNSFVADQVARACLFQSAPGVDLTVVGRLAEYAVTTGRGNEGAPPFIQVGKSLVEYRQGQFAEAAAWAQESLTNTLVDVRRQAFAVLAMAQWQLGLKNEAQLLLAQGEELAPSAMPAAIAENPDSSWLAWLFARVLLDEAKTLIPSRPTP